MKRIATVWLVVLLMMVGCGESAREKTDDTPPTTQGTTASWDTLGGVLDVPQLCQYPTLPTGCEATAAAMVLQYHGEAIEPAEFAKRWLSCSGEFYWRDGEYYGPDPSEFFVGDPFSSNGYGCYAMPIVKAINQNSRWCEAALIEGETLDVLCTRYLDDGLPLLIWVTMEMREPTDGDSWILPSGEIFTWVAGEHCVVLVGYDETMVYYNDPRTGAMVGCDRGLAEERFAQLGSQAVAVEKR